MKRTSKPIYKYCIVPMCKNTTVRSPDKLFFLIPRNAKIRQQWCRVMRRNQLSSITHMYCCEDHFNLVEDTENYLQYSMLKQEGIKIRLRLKRDVVPNIFNCQKGNQYSPPKRRNGAIKKKRKVLIENLPDTNIESDIMGPSQVGHINSYESEPSTSYLKPIGFSEECLENNISQQHYNTRTSSTDSVSDSFLPGYSLKQEDDWENENEKYKKSVIHSGMILAIEMEPQMLIGLPKKSYYLIKLLIEHIPLTTVDILITLKKIKLHESFHIIALHFGYAERTVSSIFFKSAPIIAEKMKDLIVWPKPTDIFEKLPMPLKKSFSHVVSIIDFLEIQIEKPLDSLHQSLTWSHYKKCHTLKYLISCTPYGLVNFVSEGYSGETSDAMIVHDSNYLECLPPKKAVMGDSGFTELSHLVKAKKCVLIQPPLPMSTSTSGIKDDVTQPKTQLALAQVINSLREFQMLSSHVCINHSLIPVIDEVIIICCGLINLRVL